MDSDSDEEWSKCTTKQKKTPKTNFVRDSESQSFYERHEQWFREGLEINGFEFIPTPIPFKTNPFRYRDIFNSCFESEVISEPNRYKKCVLQILSVEVAICFPLDDNDMEINIFGRALCGQSYSGDIVLVRISNKGNKEQDGKYYGEVVSLVERKRFKDVEHPIFVCLIDKRQSHLMIPVCKTVPKINILHGRLAKFYPESARSSVEIHKHDIYTCKLTFNKFFTVREDEKENWLFIVVLLKWKLTNIHPLGAVLGVVHSSQCIEEGLALISIINELPNWYNDICASGILDPNVNFSLDGYEDITQSVRVFSIDEDNSCNPSVGFSFQEINDKHIRLGVHVTDVSKIIKKGDDIDNEAKSRGCSFVRGKFHEQTPMLPEEIGNKFSLKPNQRRFSLSVLVEFDSRENGKILNYEIKKTFIKSTKSLSYLDVQNILNDRDCSTGEICELFKLSKTLRMKRIGNASFASPVVIDLSVNSCVMSTLEARSLVEELLLLTNKLVAEKLLLKFPDCVPLFYPLPLTLDVTKKKTEWYHINRYYVHLILETQEDTIERIGKISIRNAPLELANNADLDINEIDDNHVNCNAHLVPIKKTFYENICNLINHHKYDTALRIIYSDMLHPKQAIALHEWLSLQPNCTYVVSKDITVKEGTTHFTSPLCRYCDIVVQRLVHACIDDTECPYNTDELSFICTNLNTTLQKKDIFHLQCKDLLLANFVKDRPVIFQGFLVRFSEEELSILIPGVVSSTEKHIFLHFNSLDVCAVPIISNVNNFLASGQTNDKHEIITVRWMKRIYDFNEVVCKRPTKNGIEIRQDRFIKVCPYEEMCFVRYRKWVAILECAINGNIGELLNLFSPARIGELQEDIQNIEMFQDSVSDVSSEVEGQLIHEHALPFQISFGLGHMINLQISAQEVAGILSPVPTIMVLTNNIKLCISHFQDPIKTLLCYATTASLKKYRHVNKYMKIWVPIVEMEATHTAVHDKGSAIINNIPIMFKNDRGMFDLNEDYCEKRDLDFGFIPTDDKNDTSISGGKKQYFDVLSGHFLCIMINQDLVQSTKDILGHPMPYSDQFILSVHAKIVQLCKFKTTKKDNSEHPKIGNTVRVVFQLHEKSPIPSGLFECRMEIIYKSIVDRGLETHLKLLHMATDLAKNIALGKEINVPGRIHMEIANEIVDNGLDVGMWQNNLNQYWAIKTCLQKRFKLIQGPPGTGKTYIGVKLVYLFDKFNNIMHQRTGDVKNQIIFCGPSNKSVDLVAKLVIKQLREKAPRIVRIYGGAYEQLDYPIPGRATFFTRDVKPDEELVESGVVLHHVIRQDGKPYAARLRKLDLQFKDDIAIANDNLELPEHRRRHLTTTIEDIKSYKDAVSKATIEELTNYDVIFCTTSLVANQKVLKATNGKIYQLIIDESGMCSEPATIVPIIATCAKQVVLIGDHKQLRPIIKCREAAKLGLEKSLFERYSDNRMYNTMLTTQYRMHPSICSFPSKHFYNGELKTTEGIGTSHKPLKMWPKTNVEYTHYPHVFCHVDGEDKALTVKTEAGNEQSRCNQLEAEQVLKVWRYMVEVEHVDPKHINIMSQYNAQCSAITEVMLSSSMLDFTVSTVVASQGGEWEYVIFSLVRSLPGYLIQEQPTKGWCLQHLGFITDENQINVALTRAKKGIVIIGNRHLLNCDPVWRELLHDYDRKGCVFLAENFPPCANNVTVLNKKES